MTIDRWKSVLGAAAFSTFALAAALGQDIPIEPVAQSVKPAPGVTDANFSSLIYASINEAGDIGFNALISGVPITFANDSTIYTVASGATDPVLRMREDDVAPDTGGAQFDLGGFPEINEAGAVAFRSSLKGTGVTASNNFGIWIADGTGTHLVVRKSDPVTAIGGDATFSSIFGNQIPISNSGAVAFLAVLGGATVGANTWGAFAGTAGNLQLVAQRGQVAPGVVTPGVTFDFFSSISLSAADRIALFAFIQIGGSTPANDSGLWTGTPGYLSLLALEGESAPGLSGVTFDEFTALGGMSDAGSVVFGATLAGSGVTSANSSSIWAGTRGALRLVARGGQHAPGTGTGVVFGRFDDGSQISLTPTINGTGKVAFVATLTGPGVTSDNDAGLWAQDGAGNLRLVVREGDLLPAGTGADLPVNLIGLDPYGAYNGSGKLVFSTYLGGTSFSGVYLATIPQDTPVTTDRKSPTVLVSGKKRLVTTAAVVRIRGTASDDVAVARVEYRVGNKGRFKTAKGTTKWRVAAKLRPGRNKVTIRAVDSNGNLSPNQKVVVVKTTGH